jgi:ribose 5-phosphate isomerase B
VTDPKKIFFACDHAGLPLKKYLVGRSAQLQPVDLGTYSTSSVDYPDYADILANELKNAPAGSMGVLICGSGQGMAIRANRHPHVRAALCWNEEITTLARSHNNANVLCLGSRFIEPSLAHTLLQIFLKTPFEGGRHEIRVHKLSTEC